MKKFAWILAAAFAAPGLVLANDELNYNYVELGYLRADPDHLDSEDGVGLRGSFAISPNVHVFGGYDWDAIRRPHANLSGFDADAYRLGLGYNTGISDKVDFVGRVAWERIDIGSFDDDGYSAEVGIRAASPGGTRSSPRGRRGGAGSRSPRGRPRRRRRSGA